MPKKVQMKDKIDLRGSILDIVNNLGRQSSVLANPSKLTPSQSIKEMIDKLPTETMRALCAIRIHNLLSLNEKGQHISFESYSSFINQSSNHVFSLLRDFVLNPGKYDGLMPLDLMINKAETIARKAFGTPGGLALLTDSELRQRIDSNMQAVALFRGTPDFSRIYPGLSSVRIADVHDALQLDGYNRISSGRSRKQ